MTNTAKTVLVFGAAGQVGHELMRQASPGWRVIGVTRTDADIRDEAAIERVVAHHKGAALVNAAAYTAVDQAESEPDAAFAVNDTGAANLAAAAARHGCDLVHLSTDYVFDGGSRSPYREDHPIGPLGAYGRSKDAGERAVRRACERHVILRTAWVYGVHGNNFMKTMRRLASQRDVVRVVADQRGTPTAAADLAKAIYAILDQPLSGKYGTYHLTNAGETTWHGFAQHTFDDLAAHGCRTPALEAVATADYPTAAARPAYSVLDGRKAANAFAVSLRPWQQAADDVLAELQSVSTQTRGAA